MKHTINWNYIATIASAVTIIITISLVSNEKHDQVLYSTIEMLKIDRDTKTEEINNLRQNDNLIWYNKINEVTEYYENELVRIDDLNKKRLKLISDSLEVINQSKTKYGDSTRLAVLYGAMCFDHLELKERELKNRNDEVKLLKQIIVNNDSIIRSYELSFNDILKIKPYKSNRYIIYAIISLSLATLLISFYWIIANKFRAKP
ncbi:hypothetical protein [Poritiphilus flavus]|uniref:Uncharacterized protein n=1 Tax=Poritiphilus flavus TaxID=2697053 RepID=A0A6L9E7J2_9FLAO|nr:hypothetical protein [Poritiphilus flavus]NAS10604.1 hypothetical protein [Poritiphilus flavus]